MEFTILNHKVTMYLSQYGFIFRVYDCKGYVHFVIDLTKFRNRNIFWKDKNRYFNGNLKSIFKR